MKKISVASVPPIFQLVAKEDEDEGSVVCQGLTAKLHSRFGRFEDGSQGTRERKKSLMPPVPSARSSASSRKTSSSRGPDGFHPNTPLAKDHELNGGENGLQVVGETGYLALNSRKKSTAEKLSDTGFQLYTLEDSNKLPKILKPKKKGKGSKRKKIKDDQSTSSNESQGELINGKLDALKQGDKGNSDPTLGDGDAHDLYNRYGIDLKREFNMEVTRPYTFSYFPKVYISKKTDRNKDINNNKKLRKISTIEAKTSLY